MLNDALKEKFSSFTKVKKRFDGLTRHYHFDKTVRQMLATDRDDQLLLLAADLYTFWGTPLSPAVETFLQSAIKHVGQAKGTVLQCGGGLDTLVFAIVCARAGESGPHLLCLESDNHWADLVRSWALDFNLKNTHVINAGVQMYDGYVWYAIEAKQLPGNISLSISQGGEATPRGVVGLLARMQGRIAQDSVVLARQVKSTRAGEFLKSWCHDHARQCVLLDKREGFYKLTSATALRKTAA